MRGQDEQQLGVFSYTHSFSPASSLVSIAGTQKPRRSATLKPVSSTGTN